MLINNLTQEVASVRQVPDLKISPKQPKDKVNSGQVNSDCLLSQLSFMGLSGRPMVKSLIPVLDKYFEKLSQLKFHDSTILYKNDGGRPCTKILLLDNPMNFNDGLNTLQSNIFKYQQIDRPISLKLKYSPTSYCYYKTFFDSIPEFQHTSVKGIIGEGSFSTAFLTSKDEVIKLSDYPNFPNVKHFIEGVEIPILDRYVAKMNKTLIYGVKEPFAEDASVRDISLEDYNKIWRDFHIKLQNVDPNYDFDFDFKRGHIQASRQIGFIDDTPYLLDHGSILNRPLVDLSL